MQQGVDSMRLQTIGFGEGQPIADNSTEAGRQLNRRVIVTIAPQQGGTYWFLMILDYMLNKKGVS